MNVCCLGGLIAENRKSLTRSRRSDTLPHLPAVEKPFADGAVGVAEIPHRAVIVLYLEPHHVLLRA